MSQLHNYRGIPYSNHCSLPLSCFVQLFLAHPSNHWTMISISNLFIPFQGLGTPIWSQNESNLLVKQQPSPAITSHHQPYGAVRPSQVQPALRLRALIGRCLQCLERPNRSVALALQRRRAPRAPEESEEGQGQVTESPTVTDSHPVKSCPVFAWII